MPCLSSAWLLLHLAGLSLPSYAACLATAWLLLWLSLLFLRCCCKCRPIPAAGPLLFVLLCVAVAVCFGWVSAGAEWAESQAGGAQEEEEEGAGGHGSEPQDHLRKGNAAWELALSTPVFLCCLLAWS